MFEAKIENKNGAILTLTGVEAQFQVIKILGLNPPKAQLNTTTIVGMDGAVFNSSKLNTRNIVLTIRINGDVEQNRLTLYRLFKTKEWCKFYYKNGTLDTFIEGYVESVEADYFTSGETVQVSIICPSPYFKGVDEIINNISATLGLFEFPWSINRREPIPFGEIDSDRESVVHNASESECGAIFEINVNASGVTDITITDETTGDWLSLDGTKWSGGSFDGVRIVVNTNRGRKRITIDGQNGFATLREGSSFIQLQTGDNVLTYSVTGASTQDVEIRVRHYDVYRGV